MSTLGHIETDDDSGAVMWRMPEQFKTLPKGENIDSISITPDKSFSLRIQFENVPDQPPSPRIRQLAKRIVELGHASKETLTFLLGNRQHHVSCHLIGREEVNNILDLSVNEFNVPRSEMGRLKQVAEITSNSPYRV